MKEMGRETPRGGASSPRVRSPSVECIVLHRVRRARTLNSRSTGRMQLHSSGRNVSGVACRTLVICLTSLRWTVSEICASLRICPTVGSCFEGMASSVCRFNGDDASLKMYVEGCGARADAPSIYGCSERGGRLRPKNRGCTCHEILPNFGNQTVILGLIGHTQKRYNGH